MKQSEWSAGTPFNFLSGGGEMGQRIREYNWLSTPLGPIETWPQSLRTCVRIMLSSRQPIWIGWGKELIKLYNDPYKAIVGGKHPRALGQPASVVWEDIWRDIEPMLQQVMEKDEGTYAESQLLIMERNGYPEETYYTFSYTPIPGDEGGTAGMICANTDDTDRIISERQLRTLTQLGKSITDSRTNEEVIEKTIRALKENTHDFPFALFYSLADNKAILTGATHSSEAIQQAPKEIALDAQDEISFLLKQASITKKPQLLKDLKKHWGNMPAGAWSVSPDKAIILPMIQATAKEPYGFLIAGFNPYRLLDEKYSSFFSLVADQIATSFADVHVLEEERKRAEALAEIDRAKTIFFSNISHEFRTPLTLMLGPIEDALHDPESRGENKVRMDVAYRNGLRLQKLVNTLLEFSRLEAGRMDGKFSRVDLCALTQDLASTFRSAIEKAGMNLQLQCGKITGDVYVDVDMWEKIILNLISNAFKYSKEGTISVEVKQVGNEVQASVSDTGVGIPANQLHKIFDRFHRIENTKGRSQEGTGIGLSLVKELVKLHHGNIEVWSEEGAGSTFTVSIPVGKAHLPAEKIEEENGMRDSFDKANTFVEEALRWLPGQASFTESITNREGHKTAIKAGEKFRLLIADDNADMRDYISRLLENTYEVTTVANGKLALQEAAQTKPDLVISDVMMPEMDGFELVKNLKQDIHTQAIPVILLSARAGTEATIEGLQSGADDYLVKPFSAKELLTRIDSNIRISKMRQATEENIRSVFMQAPLAACILRGPEHIIELANSLALELWGKPMEAVINKPTLQAFPELVAQGFTSILDNVFQKGQRFVSDEMPVTLVRHGKEQTLYINFVYDPLRDSFGNITGIIGIGIDVTPQIEAKKIIEESERKFRSLIAESPTAIAILKGDDMVITAANLAILETWGKGNDVTGKSLYAIMPEIIDQGFKDLLQHVYQTGQPYYGHETPVHLIRNGREELVYYNFVYQAHRDVFDRIEGVAIIANEVTPYAIVQRQLSNSEERLRIAIESAEMGTWDYTPATNTIYCSDRTKEIFGFHTDDDITLEMVIGAVVAEDRERVTKAVLQAMDTKYGGHFEMECAIRTYSGETKIVRAKGTVFFTDNRVASRFIGIALDITEQRKAEEEIRSKTRELEFVTSVMPQMIWAANAEGYTYFYNDRWYEYTGHGYDDIKGAGWQNYLHPDDQDRIKADWQKAITTGEVYDVEYRLRRYDGAYRWFLSRGVAMKNEQGIIVKWYGSATDIHEQKTAAELMEQKVEERTKDLMIANQQLERSNQELEQFAFVTSHDLQEPLRKIRTFSSILFDKNKDALSDSAVGYLEKINDASKRMYQLINDLLNFSRLSRKEDGFVPVNLNEIVNNIKDDFELIIAQKNAQIICDGLPVLEAIPLQMNQLFYNLMSNALKFTSGGVAPLVHIRCNKLSAAEKEAQSLPQNETFYQIVFSDNGIGFNEKYSEKIFEIFQRLHVRSQYEGTGIGLALVSKIVLNHRGHIRAQGVEGKGASFYILLPEKQLVHAPFSLS